VLSQRVVERWVISSPPGKAATERICLKSCFVLRKFRGGSIVIGFGVIAAVLVSIIIPDRVVVVIGVLMILIAVYVGFH
jgi:hypothetical protein